MFLFVGTQGKISKELIFFSSSSFFFFLLLLLLLSLFILFVLLPLDLCFHSLSLSLSVLSPPGFSWWIRLFHVGVDKNGGYGPSPRKKCQRIGERVDPGTRLHDLCSLVLGCMESRKNGSTHHCYLSQYCPDVL